MDPLSITTSVTSLVMSAVKLSKRIHDFRSAFKNVPVSFEHLCTEYDSVSRLLYAYHARCLDVINSDEDAGDPDPISRADLNGSAYFVRTTRAVEATLKVLSARIDAFISKAEPDAAEPGIFGTQSSSPILTRCKQLRFLWDENEITRLIQYLQNYKLTLNLTLTVIADRSNEDNKKLILTLLEEQKRIQQGQLQIQAELVRIRDQNPQAQWPPLSPALSKNSTVVSELEGCSVKSDSIKSGSITSGSSATFTNNEEPPPQTAVESAVYLGAGMVGQYHEKGLTAYEAKEWTYAVQLFKKALDGCECLSGVGSDEAANARRYYAESLYMAGNIDQAIDQFEALVFWAEDKFGPEHIKTTRFRRSHAFALERRGFLDAARAEFKLAALGFEKDLGGEDGLDSLMCRYKHGLLASATDDYNPNWPFWAEAKESSQRAAQGYLRLLGPKNEQAFQAQMAYATVLLKARDDRSAREEFRKTLSMGKSRGMPKSHPAMRHIDAKLDECRFWMNHPRAQAPERADIAKYRSAKQAHKDDWKRSTGHW